MTAHSLTGRYTCSYPKCGKVCDTEGGIHLHEKIVHGIPNRKQAVCVNVSIDLLKWLDSVYENRSDAINMAIKAFKEATA